MPTVFISAGVSTGLVWKLRRLANALKRGERFNEREGNKEEIAFQLKWTNY